MILDRDTRSVLRGFQSHHRNAALEQVYLPRREGGRGLHRLSHVSEREVVSAALYVVRKAESDEHLRALSNVTVHGAITAISPVKKGNFVSFSMAC